MTQVDEQPVRTISDADVAQFRSRLGAFYKAGPYRLEVTSEDIRNNAIANGDRNPLFTDPDYGPTTRHGSQIAAPTYVDIIMHYTATALGGLPGIHAFHAGNDIEFFRPVRPGDVIGPTYRPWKIEEKEGQFAGRMLSVDVDICYRNQRDERVAVAHGNVFRVVRSTARDRGKYAGVTKPRYTDNDLEQIWRAYDTEEIRGPQPRYWESVHIGDQLGPIVRGPLRVVEIGFRDHSGGGVLAGAGGLTRGSHYYQFEEYLRRPGYAEKDETTGVEDHPHRGHWEESFARMIGVPGVYDIAVQRTAWIATLMTNWMGDDGWLRRVWCQFRKFNVTGDTTWITATVTRKWIQDDQHLIEVEVQALNQRGEDSTPGGAWIALPSRYERR